MIFENTDELRELLRGSDLGNQVTNTWWEFPDAAFDRALAQVERQHPVDTVAEQRARAAYRMLSKAPKPATVSRRRSIMNRVSPYWLWIVAILAALLILCSAAHAQQPEGLTIEIRENGTSIGFFPIFLILDCDANLTCSPGADGVTVTLAASGGGSTHDILSATHTDSLAAAVSRGSLIYGNATPAWAELVIGGVGTCLTSDGTDAAWGSCGAATAWSAITASSPACRKVRTMSSMISFEPLPKRRFSGEMPRRCARARRR